MKKRIQKIFEESIEVKEDTLNHNLDSIVATVNEMVKCLKKRGKIVFFGNGGSAADSQHIAAEFIGRFQKERKSLAAMALTTDTSILTALSNDYGYDIVFARQLEGLAKRGDVAVGISTSGNSKNVINGLKKARKLGMKTVSVTGCGGGKMKALTDINLNVPSKVTARIQESHICLFHAICELVEKNFAK